MKFEEVRELIQLIDQSANINEFKYDFEGGEIKISKALKVEQATPTVFVQEQPKSATVQPEVVKETAPIKAEENLTPITSPMVGTFYTSPSPDAPNFVSVGEKVSANTVVCIVEAMKLFNEIEAEVTGEIVEILVNNGQLVEFGQPLFLVRER